MYMCVYVCACIYKFLIISCDEIYEILNSNA